MNFVNFEVSISKEQESKEEGELLESENAAMIEPLKEPLDDIEMKATTTPAADPIAAQNLDQKMLYAKSCLDIEDSTNPAAADGSGPAPDPFVDL